MEPEVIVPGGTPQLAADAALALVLAEQGGRYPAQQTQVLRRRAVLEPTSGYMMWSTTSGCGGRSMSSYVTCRMEQLSSSRLWSSQAGPNQLLQQTGHAKGGS